MRIMFVCDTMGSGGAERVIATLSNEFSKNGHEVSIIMLSKNADTPFYPLEKGIQTYFLTKNIKSNLSFFRKARMLRKLIVSSKPDVVISFISYVCIYIWFALRHTKIPYIVSERNDPNQRGMFKQFLLDRSFKKATGCVFQTKDALNWYGKKYFKKSRVIYNPVIISEKPIIVKERKRQVLYVGRLTDQKNLFMLIDAFKMFLNINHGYILKMYGDGELKDRLLVYITQNNLTESVVISSSSKAWKSIECDSKLFVLPSKYEGMPNVLLEALCLGIPSVSTNCTIGGPKEIKDIFPDRLVLSGGISALDFCNAMNDALNIKCDSISFVPEVLTPEHVAKEWIDFLAKVVS